MQISKNNPFETESIAKVASLNLFSKLRFDVKLCVTPVDGFLLTISKKRKKQNSGIMPSPVSDRPRITHRGGQKIPSVSVETEITHRRNKKSGVNRLFS